MTTKKNICLWCQREIDSPRQFCDMVCERGYKAVNPSPERVSVSIFLDDANLIYDYICDMPDSRVRDNILDKIKSWSPSRPVVVPLKMLGEVGELNPVNLGKM